MFLKACSNTGNPAGDANRDFKRGHVCRQATTGLAYPGQALTGPPYRALYDSVRVAALVFALGSLWRN